MLAAGKSQHSVPTLHFDIEQTDTNNDVAISQQAIGNYELIKQIGSGGMGQVWLAKQLQPVNRKVAIKLVKSGLASHEFVVRFESERQVLAVMDHPSIAKVFDGGTTVDGQPYLVMEYVEGVPITEFCELYRLDLQERLRLFIRVCHAVQHAHQKGVIHRDLKPSNILVTCSEAEQAQPKVIDFGLAKAFQGPLLQDAQPSMTYSGQVLGTPLYMSPEQASGNTCDIDTRADIYALGAILYEVLTGSTPLASEEIRKLSISQLIERICNTDPPNPSSRLRGTRKETGQSLTGFVSNRGLEAVLKRDLDWIVMKSIEKDRDRRYGAVSEMADDLNRFLSGLPITARPPSLGYKIGKFSKRHRLLLCATLFCVATVILGVVGIMLALQESRRKAEAAMTATEILAAVFDDANVREIKDQVQPLPAVLASRLELAAERLDQENLGDPTRQAQLQMRLGAAMLSLGRPQKAVEVLESACRVLCERKAHASQESLACSSYLAEAYSALGKDDRALAILQKIYEDAGQAAGLDPGFVLETKGNLATAYVELDEFVKGTEMLRETVLEMGKLFGEADHRTLVCKNNLAFALEHMGHLDEAHQILEQSLPDAERTFGEDHVHTMSARNNLAKVLYLKGDRSQACMLFEKNYHLLNDNLGEGHAQTIDALGNLAHVYMGTGDIEKGGELLLQLIEAKRPQYDLEENASRMAFANLLQRVAESLIEGGQPARAQPLLQEWKTLRSQSQSRNDQP